MLLARRVLTSQQKLRKDPLTQMKIVVVFHLEKEDGSFIDWLISHLPDFIGNIFSNRVPVSSIENHDAISVLQFQYNILVVLMAFSHFCSLSFFQLVLKVFLKTVIPSLVTLQY